MVSILHSPTTVDGRNPFRTTSKLWETIVGIYKGAIRNQRF